jgi:multidrug transporter EmrE-like cation transporter
MSNLILLVVAAFSNSLALTMLKFTGDKLRDSGTLIETLKISWWMVLLGLAFYCISFILSIKILSDSVFFRAVPIFVGINIVFSLLISLAVFREPLSLSATFGALLIVVGVWFIQTSSL